MTAFGLNTAQLELEVAPVAPHRERPQEDGSEEVLLVVLPLRHADAQVHGVDAARGGQFERFRRDRGCGDLRGAQRDVVADEVRQQGRLARDELGQATGMRRAQFEPRARSVLEVQQRRATAEAGDLSPPAVPHRFGDVAAAEVAQVVRHRRRQRGRGDLRKVVFLHESEVVVLLRPIGTPHNRHHKREGRRNRGDQRGFAHPRPFRGWCWADLDFLHAG
jgi:hypothetical protein